MAFVKGGIKLSHDLAGWWESRRNRGLRDRRRGKTAAAAAALVGLIVGLVGAVVVAAPVSATAATAASSCSFANAGSGTYARTLCWFDMSPYNATTAASAAGQTMSVALPGGYSISFTLKVSGGPVKATAFPTYGGAYLGNGAYTGVTGKPALYQTQSGTTTTATLSGISVVDSQGNPVTGYSFVGADAESTDTGESITWTSNQPLSLISKIGNACNSGALLTGVGSTTVKCSATVSSTKTGTAILAAEAPATFSQTFVGQGLQAVAFGVLVSTVQVNKTVASRINPSDAFAVNVSSSTGSLLGSANTGTAATATTGQITVLTSSAGQSYTLSESATSGLLSDYQPAWSCTRNGATDPSLPAGPAGPSASVTLGIGDFVNCTITNTAQTAALSLVKHAGIPNDVNRDGITDAGDTIAYTFTVTNTGALTMSNVAVSDLKAGPVTCPQPTLASGASETCTANNLYAVTAADDTAGTVLNTATASGVPAGGIMPVPSAPSSTSTPTQTPSPAVAVVKTANASGGDTNPLTAGETINYSYLVTNTGNDNLTAVAVSDLSLGAVTCPTPASPGLAPGASETCTAAATYTVTQADLDAGKVTDTATATGTDSDGNTSQPAAAGATSSVTVPTAAAAPAVAVDKTATLAPAADQDAAKVGDTIAYTYQVTNTGNVDLSSVAVNDPTLGTVTCPTPASPGLAPGASETCTADQTHTVTQADLDAGKVTDTATATGTDAAGLASPTSAPSTVTVPSAPAAPALSLVKTGTVAPAADQDAAKLGDTIAYTYVVTNTGNVDLSSVVVNDPTLGAVTCPTPASPGLAPGGSETCTADQTHTVTQADLDTGKVTDTATATGTDTTGTTSNPSQPSTATVPTVPAALAVSLVKTGTVAPAADQDAAKLGDTIAYSYLVTNTGNVDLSSVAVNDPTLGAVTCPTPASPGLAPGGSEICSADQTHTVTQADLDAGKVTDTATATGTDFTGTTSGPSAPSTATIPTVPGVPAVTIDKIGDASTGDTSSLTVGETIAYAYLVTNTGNVDLTSLAVDDSTLGAVTCPSPAPPGLAPGGSETCTANQTHTVTQADLDAGKVTDTATAIGTDTAGDMSPASAPSTDVIPQPATPLVAIDKTATVTPAADQSQAKLGDSISYSYVLTNTGNVDLTSVAVNDPTLGAVTCPTPTSPGLAPSGSETCTAAETHTVTQADVDAGDVADTATATGTDTTGDTSPASAPSTATILTEAPQPTVTLVKIADASTGDTSSLTVGETIAYSYLVTNTGNVTLPSVAVNDPTLGPVACPTPASPGLAPGGSEICTAAETHTVTQTDVDAGEVTDTATATAIDTSGTASPVSSPSTVVVPQPAAPAVAIDKAATVAPAADQDAAKVGDTIAYSYTVTNTGNVTLASVAVNDPTLGAVTCRTPSSPGLAPGGSEVCTADETHTVSQADVDAGRVTDTATATGTDTTGVTSPTSAPSTATTLTAAAAPAVSLVKTGTVAPAADQAAARVGDAIAYSFEVTNTGNVTLASVAVSDPTGGAVTCPTPAAPGLAPGRATTCTGDSRHLVSEADLAAGKVVDTATATGTDTRGRVSPPSDPSTATIPVVTDSTSQPNSAAPTPPAPASTSVSTPSDPSDPPAATDPAATDPAATDPAATDPAATDPAATDPAATDPAAAAVAATDPTSADPPADPAPPTTVLPDGLGSISTDLGRWIPGHDGLGQLGGGLGLIVAGGVVVILRRRRRSSGQH